MKTHSCLPCLLLAHLPAHPPVVVQITDKDAEVLSYCTDVRCERFHGEDDAEEVRRGHLELTRKGLSACPSPGQRCFQPSVAAQQHRQLVKPGQACDSLLSRPPTPPTHSTHSTPTSPPTHPPTHPPAVQGVRLVFDFRENPFFTNKQLVKTYHLSEADDMMLSKIESEWQP